MLPIAVVVPALAAGSNTSTALPPPPTPPPTITTNPQAATLAAATCQQQLQNAINNAAIAATAFSVVSDAAAAAVIAAPPPFDVAAAVVAVVADAATSSSNTAQNVLQAGANSLPSCDQTFTGTVKVGAGGVNVTGNSVFQNDVGVAGNLTVSGALNVSQLHASQGVSAMGGAITLGDPNGTTYSDGITLGGGALSGAGFGGLQAFTGDVTAIAIGNGASAFSVNSTAIGTGANAIGVNSTAVGAGANASGTNAVSIGVNSSAAFTNSTAFGVNATATRDNQQMFGTSSNTYSMPGITSASSRSAQSGLLQLPTTDSAGNLASDGGATFMAIARAQAGVAVAMAMGSPTLAHGEKFGIRVGWGGFASYGGASNALAFNAAGVLAENTFSKHDRLTIDAGFGVGNSQFLGYSQSAVVGGRAGAQLTW